MERGQENKPQVNCSATLKSNFSHCMQEDIPNSIEPVFNCFKKSLIQKEQPEDHNNQEINHDAKKQWVVLEGTLMDKRGYPIVKYVNQFKEPREDAEDYLPEIQGEPILFYYGPEKNYGLIIYPRVSVLGHACFYEGFIQYGKPSDKGVFIGANCRYLIHSLDEKGSGVIKCLNYCNIFPFTKCKVFTSGKVVKCTSLLANGFIFYGLDEYGTGFFKLYGLDKLIRGNLNGENFKLEIKGDILSDTDSEDGKSRSVEELLNQLRQEKIRKELNRAKQESENSGSRGKSKKELDTISEQTKSRQTFDSTSKKQSNSLFKIFPKTSQKGSNSCSNLEEKSEGIAELLKEPKFLEINSAVKTSKSGGMLSQEMDPKPKQKSLFFQNQNSENQGKKRELTKNKSEVVKKSQPSDIRHKRRVSRDSDFYIISDSSEQNRSKINWYSMMDSEKSLQTEGQRSSRKVVAKSTKSELPPEKSNSTKENRTSLNMMPSPIVCDGDEIFGELSRKISKIVGSEKHLMRVSNPMEASNLISESQKSLAFEKKLESEMDFVGKEGSQTQNNMKEDVVTDFNSIFDQLNTIESRGYFNTQARDDNVNRRNSLACKKELDIRFGMGHQEDNYMRSLHNNAFPLTDRIPKTKVKPAKSKSKGKLKKSKKTKKTKNKNKQLKMALAESKERKNYRATLTRNELNEIRKNQNKNQQYIQNLILGRGNKKKSKVSISSTRSVQNRGSKSTISSKKINNYQSTRLDKSEQVMDVKDLQVKEYKSRQTPSRKMNFLKKKTISYVDNKVDSIKRKSKSKEQAKSKTRLNKSKRKKKSKASWVNGELIHNVDSIVGETLQAMDFEWINKQKQRSRSKGKARRKSATRAVKSLAQNTISSIGTVESNLVFGKGQTNFEDLYLMNRDIIKSKRKNKQQISLNEHDLDQFIQNRIVEDSTCGKSKVFIFWLFIYLF
jgi:hypothetical protein